MCTRVRAQTIQHASQGRTLDYSPIEWQQCFSFVQAVVPCNVTALRVCTLVLKFSLSCVCVCVCVSIRYSGSTRNHK